MKQIHFFSYKFIIMFFFSLHASLYSYAMQGEQKEETHKGVSFTHPQSLPSENDAEGHLIPIFTGYDRRAPIGHHICEESILQHSTQPVTVTPLYLSTLKGAFDRDRTPTQLTDFTYSRFIVPYLCNYKGWAIFIDGNDMMLREDIAKLWQLRDERYAVMVVKHPEFQGTHSFMSQSIQTYPMLNWSSMMLFNNEKCRQLTREYVHTAGYYDLHQFKWLDDPSQIGDLPSTWNHLVKYYEPSPDAALVHWTLGAPYQGGEFAKTEHAKEWFELYQKFTSLPVE